MTSKAETSQIYAVGRKIEKWLGDEGFNTWKSAEDNSHFSYKATRDDCQPLLVFQPQSKTDSFQVAGDMKLTRESQNKLREIPEKQRRFMLFDFKMALLSTECHWQFTPSPESWKTVRVSKTVFYDGLSKDRFFETVDAVTRAMSVVILTFQWKFNVTPYVS